MNENLSDQITQALKPLFDDSCLELVSLKVAFQRSGPHIDILADKLEGGITIDECSMLSHRIKEALEKDLFAGKNYSLSVASPGIDFPLKTKRDFLRVGSRNIRVLLNDTALGKGEYCGVVEKVEDEFVYLKQISKDDKFGTDYSQELIPIPFNKIIKAVQIV